MNKSKNTWISTVKEALNALLTLLDAYCAEIYVCCKKV